MDKYVSWRLEIVRDLTHSLLKNRSVIHIVCLYRIFFQSIFYTCVYIKYSCFKSLFTSFSKLSPSERDCSDTLNEIIHIICLLDIEIHYFRSSISSAQACYVTFCFDVIQSELKVPVHICKDKDAYVLPQIFKTGEHDLRDMSLTFFISLATSILSAYALCCFQQVGVPAHSFLCGSNLRGFQ